jgi:hypothetical protein
MEIKKDISEILSSKTTDGEKLWALMRTLQRVFSYLEKNMAKSEELKLLANEIKSLPNPEEVKLDVKKDLDSFGKMFDKEIKRIKSLEDGKDGLNGKDGKDGRDGVDGKDGKDGRDGIDGKGGVNGKDGINGKDGKDGSPDTPEEVVSKVKKLGIPMSAVNGLEEALYRARSKKSGSGGGMGNVENELKSVSSATTSITTNHPILGGAAVWLDYNGQTLARGTHYTVGSDRQTITLTFTPDDGTTIQVIYIVG